MRAIADRLTYANVVATLALVIAVGGSAAYAANTVFSSDIVDGEVKAADIAPSAVRGEELAANQIRTGEIRDDVMGGGGLTSADVRDRDQPGGGLDGWDIALESLDSFNVLNESLSGDEIFNGSLRAADIGDDAVGASELAAGSIEATDPAATNNFNELSGVPLLFRVSSGGGSAGFTAPRDMRMIDVWAVNEGVHPAGAQVRIVRAGLCEHFPPPVVTVPMTATAVGGVNHANFIDTPNATFAAGETWSVCFPANLTHVYVLAAPE